MSTKPPHPTIIRDTASQAWIEALRILVSPGDPAGAPMTVSFSQFDEAGFPSEDPMIRSRLDLALSETGGVAIDINSAMIFPLANLKQIEAREGIEATIEQLSSYYQTLVYPKLRERNKFINGKGTYFLRMIAFGKPPGDFESGGINQIQRLIELWNANPHLKQSTLQLALRDPSQDLNGNARRPFPCLQQVAVGYDSNGLSITGFYPTQSIFDRAYGNYLGLAHLGWFIARATGRRLVRVSCMTASPGLGTLLTSKTILRNRFNDLF